MSWPTPWSLRQLEIYELRWELPEDAYWEEEEYKLEHGDYLTNAKGHKKVRRYGVECIVIPGRRIYKLKRTMIQQAVRERIINDGQDAVSQQGIRGQLQDMRDRLDSTVAVATGERSNLVSSAGASSSSGRAIADGNVAGSETTPKKAPPSKPDAKKSTEPTESADKSFEHSFLGLGGGDEDQRGSLNKNK